MEKEVEKYFEQIIYRSHFWNWAPDWFLVKDIYERFPEAYSVLTPFTYSYLEELIRSTTSEYGYEIRNIHGEESRRVGKGLINLAINENSENIAYVELLNRAKKYFDKSSFTDRGDNRNGVAHGYSHPRFWTKDSFEELLSFTAKLSEFAKF